MGKYYKDSHRINIKYINGDTNELLFEVKNQSWMDVGTFFTDQYTNDLMKQSGIPEDNLPKNIIVLIASTFTYR